MPNAELNPGVSFGVEFLRTVTNGDPEAYDFLLRWGKFHRKVDDVIDCNLWDAEHVLEAFVEGCKFYSHPFYQKNMSVLQMPILMATNFCAVSVKWEREKELWKRQWADVLRHSGLQVVESVAMICGGWELVTKTTAPYLAAMYVDHKDRHGVPT